MAPENCISSSVKKLIVVLWFAISAFAATGSFVGQVVNGPNSDAGKKWAYVQGPHGSVRRVDVSGAKIVYGTGVAKKDRTADSVPEGAQVRVTAFQDGEGEWKATRVEIVTLTPK